MAAEWHLKDPPPTIKAHSCIEGHVTKFCHPTRLREGVPAIFQGEELAEKESSFRTHFAGNHLQPSLDSLTHCFWIRIRTTSARATQRCFTGHSGLFQAHAKKSAGPLAG